MKRKWKFPHISMKARESFYKIPCWIKKVGYLYPDGKFSYKQEPCKWGEREGYPACTLQLVCPYVGNYRHNSKGEKISESIGRCSQECLDPQIRQAIEAFVTLHPHIM